MGIGDGERLAISAKASALAFGSIFLPSGFIAELIEPEPLSGFRGVEVMAG